MTVVGVIPARGGSKGLPGKNIMMVNGIPLIGYVIKAALAAKSLDLVVVSTEDKEIAKTAAAYDVRVIDRPAEIACDITPIDPALRHAVRTLEAEGMKIDIAVWLQANVPTTKPSVIDEAVDKLRKTGADSVQTVIPYRVGPQFSWTVNDGRLEQLGHRLLPDEGCLSAKTTRRQDATSSYHLDGSVNALRRDVLMNAEGQPGQSFFGNDRRAIVMDRARWVEVDDQSDMDYFEFLLHTNRV